MRAILLRTIVMFLVICLIIPAIMVSAEEEMSFQDVSETYWAKDAIDSLVQLGIINGFEDHTFKPSASVTREQFAQLITLSFFLDLPEGDEQTFVDVSKTRWSYPAIEASKEFLTGFYPPSGRAFFDPTANATREDVAVALVKTLGYQPDELENAYILDSYYDADQISPNIRTYLALAVEKKLLAGYEDRTIRPANAVTRAEAASLLYRILKGASGDSQQVLALNVEVPDAVQSPTFYIAGDVTKGAKVFINNQEVEVVQGQFRLAMKLDEEGVYTYTIVARLPGGKTQTVTKTVKFEKGAPELTVTGVPEVTNQQQITVVWTVKDANDFNPTVYVNDEEQPSYATSKLVNLQDGANQIVVRAVNASGKSTEIIKRVLFQSSGPLITVEQLPQTTNKEMLTVYWTVNDPNDSSPRVSVNGADSSYENHRTIQLKEGPNTLSIKAINKLGKETEVIKTITFDPPAPELKLGPIPESASKQQLTVDWQVTDINDYSPVVYVNGEKNLHTSASLSLNQGVNTITIKAVNKFGKMTELSKQVTFTSAGPMLQVTPLPASTSKKQVNVSWRVTDANDHNPSVFTNDQLSYSSPVTVNLTMGMNVILVKASNSLGQVTEQSHEIYFEPSAPTILLGYAPQTTTSSSITLSWTATDENETPMVYINDQPAYYGSQTLYLSAGENVFRIVAANSYGKTTEVVYAVEYIPTP